MQHDWLLELGHTRLKLARRERGTPGRARSGAVVAMARERLGEWLDAERPEKARFWISAVPTPEVVAELTRKLDRRGIAWQRVGIDACELPVRASYPEMGVDRWLALQPVWAEMHESFCLVDCGTAMTIDLVDDSGVHAGGWIVPGPDAARAGLLQRAPGLSRPDPGPVDAVAPARNTADQIERGLLLQQAGTVELALRIARDTLGRTPPLVLTGGAVGPLQSIREWCRNRSRDRSPYSGSLEGDPVHRLWVEPDLVLQGLAMAVELLDPR